MTGKSLARRPCQGAIGRTLFRRAWRWTDSRVRCATSDAQGGAKAPAEFDAPTEPGYTNHTETPHTGWAGVAGRRFDRRHCLALEPSGSSPVLNVLGRERSAHSRLWEHGYENMDPARCRALAEA